MDIGFNPYSSNILGGFQAPKQTNKAPIIPTQPMMSYNVKGNILSGVDDEDAKKVIAYVDSKAKSEDEKKILLQEAHQAALKATQQKQFKKDREDMKAQIMTDMLDKKNTADKSQLGLSLKIANFSDIIRQGASKEGIDLSDMDDKTLIAEHLKANPNQQQLFLDYTNNKKTGLDVGRELGLIQEKPKEQKVDTNIDTSTLEGIGIGIGGTALGLGASYGIGKGAEALGKEIFGVTLPPMTDEARAIQTYKAGLGPKPRTTIESALDKPIAGTRSMIGVQSQKEANKIFTDTVNPMLKNSQAKTNVNMLIDSLGDDIEKLAKGDPDKLKEYQEALKEMQASFSDKKYSQLPTEELHTLKSGLQGRTPQKFYKGKEITNAYKELRGQLAKKLTSTLHDTLAAEYGVDSAKMYKDYANLKGLSEVGVKSMTQAGVKGGFGGFRSTVVEELATPATTVGGKSLYKLGQLLQKPAEITLGVVKKVLKSGKGLLSADPTGILTNIVENEVYTKDLKGGQFELRQQMVNNGMDKEQAAEEAKKVDENKSYMFF